MRWLVLAVVLLAGCSSPQPTATEVGNLPWKWNWGVPMEASQMGGDHGGGRSAELVAVVDMDQPARCMAYRDSVALSSDSCSVGDAYAFGGSNAPWAVHASWASCPTHDFNGCHNHDRPAPYKARVVAFNGLGEPIAWWDGRQAEGMGYVTE